MGGVGGWRCAAAGRKHAACGGWRSHATVRAAGGACRGLKAQGTRKGGTGKKLSKGLVEKTGVQAVWRRWQRLHRRACRGALQLGIKPVAGRPSGCSRMKQIVGGVL